MTETELYDKLKPLEPTMLQYIESKSGYLSPEANAIIKECYPTLLAMSSGGLPRVYKSSCSSCVKTVFNTVCSLYFRLKEKAGE